MAPKRTRKDEKAEQAEPDGAADEVQAQKAKPGRRKKAVKEEGEEGGSPDKPAPKTKKQQAKKEGKAEAEGEGAAGGDEAEGEEGGSPSKKPKRAKKEVAVVTERTPAPVPPLPADTPTLKVISWNVNGLASVVRSSLAVLQALVERERPDVLCLQETKLQTTYTVQHEGILKGYRAFWNCCTAKKGYSGTAVFVKDSLAGTVQAPAGGDDKAAKGGGQQKMSAFFKKKDHKPETEGGGKEGGGLAKLLDVNLGFLDHDSNAEGRVICCEFDKLFVVGVYVPNSGMQLERLQYRLNDFNPSFSAFLRELALKKPVVCTGDLNVATFDEDIYNVAAPHVKKVPGCTPQEREAQQAFLASGWVDIHRHLYPEATGQYTYWNVRTQARKDNRGLRLDYFLVDKDTVEGKRGLSVLQSYILHEGTEGVSDHCPVALVLGPAP